jgi:hypothetical protein
MTLVHHHILIQHLVIDWRSHLNNLCCTKKHTPEHHQKVFVFNCCISSEGSMGSEAGLHSLDETSSAYHHEHRGTWGVVLVWIAARQQGTGAYDE